MWNSNSQGVKETFIQTSRRGRDGQPGGERRPIASWQTMWARGLVDWETKDSKPLAVKHWGGCEGGRDSSSHKTVRWKVGLEWSKWHCPLSDSSLIDSATMLQRGLICPGEYAPLQHRCAKTKKYEMKEQIKTPEKDLSGEEIDNLSDAEFKTLVIRMLTDMIEFGCKVKEEMRLYKVR